MFHIKKKRELFRFIYIFKAIKCRIMLNMLNYDNERVRRATLFLFMEITFMVEVSQIKKKINLNKIILNKNLSLPFSFSFLCFSVPVK